MTEAMKNIDLRKVDKAALRDRSTVHIDPEAPTEERIRAWIEAARQSLCLSGRRGGGEAELRGQGRDH